MKRWWLILVAGCSGGTSARLTVHSDPAWQLGGFEVGADGERRSLPVSSTVHVLLPDSWAGKPLPIDLWGMRDQDRFAYGTTTITPVRGKEVTGEIVMARVPCGAWCTAGATSCSADGVTTCTESDECFVFSNPSPCPAAAPYCSNGACAATCTDECVTGALRCAGPGAVEGCGQNDSDSCNDWLQPSPCPQGQVCSNGVCGTMCQDECTAGDSQCSGDGAITCGDFDGNGCTEWGPVVPCSCVNGRCKMMSSPSPSPCDGVTCDTPPSPSCISTTTLRTFSAGTCMNGDCQFPSTDTTCAAGCSSGACACEHDCWNTVTTMPTPRLGLAAAAGPDGRIYTIGGADQSGNPMSTVEAFSPATNSWATVASLPTARMHLTAALGSDGRIYAMGGWVWSNSLTTVEAYNPSTDKWAGVASLHTARNGLAAAAGPDGRIYAIGGWNLLGGSSDPSATQLSTVEAYTPGTNSWATVAPLPTARGYLAAAAGSDGRIFAIGGTRNDRWCSEVEVYSASSNSWATAAPIDMWVGYLAAALGSDDRIYSIGGDDSNGARNIVAAYTAGTNNWASVAPLSTGRYAFAAVATTGGRIYVFGGGAGSNVPVSTVEAYTP